jgi:hypothetical protein
MAEILCSHPRRRTGIFQCDLSHASGEGSLYSAELSLGICEQCGQVQLYCESHELVCSWLANKKPDGEPAD